jgi:hypothetical protein
MRTKWFAKRTHWRDATGEPRRPSRQVTLSGYALGQGRGQFPRPRPSPRPRVGHGNWPRVLTAGRNFAFRPIGEAARQCQPSLQDDGLADRATTRLSARPRLDSARMHPAQEEHSTIHVFSIFKTAAVSARRRRQKSTSSVSDTPYEGMISFSFESQPASVSSF